MTTYFFYLKDGGEGSLDNHGMELPDDAAAVHQARDVARELMRHCEKETRHWRIEVLNQDYELIDELTFASIDETLDHLAPQARHLIERWSESRLLLDEAVHNARVTARQSRALVARSRGKPYLATERGKLV